MKMVDGVKIGDAYVSMNNVALNKEDISSFSWDENKFEVQVFMRSGHEHLFSFNDVEAFAEAVWKLSG